MCSMPSVDRISENNSKRRKKKTIFLLSEKTFCCVCFKTYRRVQLTLSRATWCSVAPVVSDSVQLCDCSPPASLSTRFSRPRIPEWVTVPSSRDSSWPRDHNPHLLCFLHHRQILYPLSHVGYPVTQSSPTVCSLMDCSTPGFPVLHCLPEFAQTHVNWARPSNHLIFCHPFLLLPSVFLSLSIFSNEKTLFTSGAKASALASVLPINIQGWFPLRSPILSYLTYNFSFRGRLNIFLCQQVFICRMIVNESVLVYR